jgi:hypothetical protein
MGRSEQQSKVMQRCPRYVTFPKKRRLRWARITR